MVRFKTPGLNIFNPHYTSIEGEVIKATIPYSLSDGEKIIWAQDLRIGIQYGSSSLDFNLSIYGADTIRKFSRISKIFNQQNVPISLYYDKNDLRSVRGFVLK